MHSALSGGFLHCPSIARCSDECHCPYELQLAQRQAMSGLRWDVVLNTYPGCPSRGFSAERSPPLVTWNGIDMNNQLPAPLARFRQRPLTVCLAAAFVAGSMMTAPVLAATTWKVGNCQDNGAPGSLRDVATNPYVKSGDTIDLSGLPLACGTKDRVITLNSAIPTHDDVTLKGPNPSVGSVTIDAQHLDQVIVHGVSGTLTIQNLTIANGGGGPRGGCVRSFIGNVYMSHSVVTGCEVTLAGPSEYDGGGIDSTGDVVLVHSTVSGNTINKVGADATVAHGGGVFAQGNIGVYYSSVRDNHVVTQADGHGQGGGLFSLAGTITVDHSTIEGNSANGRGGGIALSQGPSAHSISNSTISGNTGLRGGGIDLTGYGKLKVYNSTIAFNHATYSQAGFGGLVGCYGCSVSLQSSIVANNTDGLFNAPSDLYADLTGLLGSDNLVMSTNVFAPPAGIIVATADPKLGPLQINGAATRTHALLSGSPAIGMGKNLLGYPTDQRGAGYPRTTGPNVKVDIGAFEFDSIFANTLEAF